MLSLCPAIPGHVSIACFFPKVEFRNMVIQDLTCQTLKFVILCIAATTFETLVVTGNILRFQRYFRFFK